jgi:hypothetical protein
MSPFHRGLLKAAQKIHLYVTLLTLVLILFFAASGFMLNHEDWFSPTEPYRTVRTGTIASALLAPVDRLGIVESLRKDFGAVGLVETFEDEDDRIRVVFKRPGTQVTAEVLKASGMAEVAIDTRGWTGLFLDLHRGKATGQVWRFVLDAVCLSLVIIALTGLILFQSLKGRGRFGWMILILGAMAGFVGYLTVP